MSEQARRETIERELEDVRSMLAVLADVTPRATNALAKQALACDKRYHEGRRDAYRTVLSLDTSGGGGYIEIPETLLHAALRECDPLPSSLHEQPEEKGHTTDVSRSLIEGMIEQLDEDLMCDHSVGICMCSTIALVGELKLALDGKMTCPQCHGDGFDWNDDRFTEAARKYVRIHGGTVEGAKLEIGDDPGYVDCPRCGGGRWVPIKTAVAAP